MTSTTPGPCPQQGLFADYPLATLWPDAAVSIALLICLTAVLIALIRRPRR